MPIREAHDEISHDECFGLRTRTRVRELAGRDLRQQAKDSVRTHGTRLILASDCRDEHLFLFTPAWVKAAGVVYVTKPNYPTEHPSYAVLNASDPLPSIESHIM